MNESVFYYVAQPGDNLSRIAEKKFQFVAGKTTRERVASLLAQNPHIKDANKIYSGEILYLGSSSPRITPYPFGESDHRDFVAQWKRADPETKRIIQKNFDVLEWLSTAKDSGEFLNALGEQSRPVFEAIQEYKLEGVIPGELWRLSTKLREMIRVRRETIEVMRRFQLSVSREPILIFTYTRNSLYPASQCLKRILDLTHKIRLGRSLTYFEIGLEGIKVAQTALRTKSAKKTIQQAGRGGSKVLGGISGIKAGKVICRMTVSKGPQGWILCGVSLAAGIFGGSKMGEVIGKGLFGPQELKEIPPLP